MLRAARRSLRRFQLAIADKAFDPNSNTRVILAGQNLKDRAKEWAPATFDLEKSKSFKVGHSELSVKVVSSESSRFNCPTRPDLLSSSVAADLADGVDEVVIPIASDSEILTSTLAIARAMPCGYNLKKKGDAPGKPPTFALKQSAHSNPLKISFLSQPLLNPNHLEISARIGESVQFCQTLVDAAPNHLGVTEMVETVRNEFDRLDLKIPRDLFSLSFKIIQGDELREKGFGGMWGVGKGASTPPALVHLSFEQLQACETSSTSVIVGKGVMYDSGGLALKPRDGMSGMKRDMGGAAACLSAFSAIVDLVASGQARLKSSRLDCILCVVENSIGPASLRNDDVIELYSGLTAEINNTDAEGRLILADAVAYASKQIPSVSQVIDLATLTGAATYAAGHLHGGLLCNTNETEQALVEAGKLSGDLLFPMLWLPEVHANRMQSDVADLMNTSNPKDDLPSSCAGWFIWKNLEASGYKGSWAHIDMAKPVTFLKGRASGYGVGLLSRYLMEWE